MIRRLITLSLVASFCVLAIPSLASATDYCVGTTPVVCPVQDFTDDAAGLALARDAANGTAGADRIFLGAGSYSAQPSSLNLAFGEKVEIIGAGRSQVSFPWSTPAFFAAVDVQFATADSYMSGFTVDLTGTPDSATGISVLGGEIRDFAINDNTTGTTGTVQGISVKNGATASNFESTVVGVNQGIGVAGSGITIEDGELSATGSSGNAIGAGTNGTVDIRRVKIRGFYAGIVADLGDVNVSDSSIDLGSMPHARGFELINQNTPMTSNVITADLDRVTVYGTGTPQRGLYFGAENQFGFESVFVTLTDSLIDITHSSSRSIECSKAYDNPAEIEIVRSAYDPARYYQDGSQPPVMPPSAADCTETLTDNLDTTAAVPTYENAANGDLRPASGSPMIDAGGTGSLLANGALDVVGSPRLNDGDGNCVAKLDLGAYEFQLATPPGCVPQTTPPTTPPTTPTTPLATAKLTSRAKKAFKRSKSGFRKRTNPKATAFGVTFKNAQVARFEIQQVLRGVKKRGKCKRGSKGGKRCTYYKKIPGIQRQDVYDGEIFYQFGGQIGGKKLKAGNYRVIITPFGEGAVIGTPVAVPFKLK